MLHEITVFHYAPAQRARYISNESCFVFLKSRMHPVGSKMVSTHSALPPATGTHGGHPTNRRVTRGISPRRIYVFLARQKSICVYWMGANHAQKTRETHHGAKLTTPRRATHPRKETATHAAVQVSKPRKTHLRRNYPETHAHGTGNVLMLRAGRVSPQRGGRRKGVEICPSARVPAAEKHAHQQDAFVSLHGLGNARKRITPREMWRATFFGTWRASSRGS